MKRPLLVVLGSVLLMAGCDDSQVPLSDPTQAAPDPRLAGVWQQKYEGGSTYYLVGRLGGMAPESVMRVVTVGRPDSGELQEPQQFLLFPTDLGGKSYLNVAEATPQQLTSIREKGWNGDLIKSYFLVKYRVEGDAVLVWTMSLDAKKTTIETGKIKGEINQGDGASRVRFTDTTSNVAKFVAEKGDSLYPNEPLRFERLR